MSQVAAEINPPQDSRKWIKTMGFKCGIVGLPNVGKSTLFNALTQSQAAEAANFPFTTIEPNVGRVSVPDVRLDEYWPLLLNQNLSFQHKWNLSI